MDIGLQERKRSILNDFRLSNTFKVVFICSGNIIRSPYAHLLFEHLIQEDNNLKSKVRVESGGVTYRNSSISYESHEMLLKEGVPSKNIDNFKPRYLSDYPKMFEDTNLILVMEKNHIRKIPESIRDKTFLLLEFTQGKIENVPDPFFNPPFDRSFLMIKESVIYLREFLNSE